MSTTLFLHVQKIHRLPTSVFFGLFFATHYSIKVSYGLPLIRRIWCQNMQAIKAIKTVYKSFIYLFGYTLDICAIYSSYSREMDNKIRVYSPRRCSFYRRTFIFYQVEQKARSSSCFVICIQIWWEKTFMSQIRCACVFSCVYVKCLMFYKTKTPNLRNSIFVLE